MIREEYAPSTVWSCFCQHVVNDLFCLIQWIEVQLDFFVDLRFVLGFSLHLSNPSLGQQKKFILGKILVWGNFSFSESLAFDFLQKFSNKVFFNRCRD